MTRKRSLPPRRAAAPGETRENRSGTRWLTSAVAACRAGHPTEARRLCLQSLKANPRDPEGLHFLGLLEHQLGQHENALRLIQRAIAASPANALYYSNLGVVLRAVGRAREALEAFEQALRLHPQSADAHNNMGLIHLDQENLGGAEAAFRRSLALRPGCAAVVNNLGQVRFRQGGLNEAEALFLEALTLDGTLAETHNNLGKLRLAKQLPAPAETSFRQALALAPEFAEAHNSLGLALYRQDRAAAAEACFRRALELKPDFLEAHSNLAVALQNLGRSADARLHAERALALRPSFAEARWVLSILQLQEGDFAAGWRNYEARNHIARIAPRRFPLPLWQGQPLHGARLLLHAEQGLGDTLQFLRFVPLLQAEGGTVVLDVPSPLRRLAASLPGVAELVASGKPTQPCAWQCPLMSLPLALATRLETIPSRVPYLSVPEDARAKADAWPWPADGLRVGLVWAGGPAHLQDKARSLPFSRLRPLLDVEKVHFYSLQVGPAAEQARDDAARIANPLPSEPEMADTAAFVEHLHLVISVDTAVAHLAGALGKPCWILLPHAADWRWLLNRDDSPWYPTVRLFRQPQPGDWEAVVQKVHERLHDTAQGERLLLSPPDGSVTTAAEIPPQPTPLSDAGEAARRREVTARGETDRQRWSTPGQLETAWNLRAMRAADYIPAGARVLDLGCGRMALERFLPNSCAYVPCDLVARDHRTVLCDLNAGNYPDDAATAADIVVLLGVFEYIYEPRALLDRLRRWQRPVVLSYCATDAIGDAGKRRGLGWVNSLSCAALAQLARDSGFAVQCAGPIDSSQWLFRLIPNAAQSPALRRVGVLSFCHVGNFGDRLGFHLLNQILPAHAEVTHLHQGTGAFPHDAFDLLLVGMGNSLFGHHLDENLLRLVERSHVSIGIFGTQYHDSMPRSLLHRLLDRLDHWYARHEEDLLRYGRGRSHASHLGDWLIHAFPMARPTKTERLDIGSEVWNDLPLDRTIPTIQQYAAVFATRMHPLLCALTSAERVGYREQRESGSGAPSGQFRSMFLDIFGRDFPEEEFFEVDRSQVVRYKTEVAARIAQVRARIGSLLAAG